MSARIRRISTSHRPVFLVNSRLGLFSAASLEAPLLPKLRGHFAEFLNKGSPVRLRIFFSSTCVGLRYGHLKPYLAAFLASVDSPTSINLSPSEQPLLTCVLHYMPRSFPWTRFSIRALRLSSCVTASFIRFSVVPESLPVVHHLRLSAST